MSLTDTALSPPNDVSVAEFKYFFFCGFTRRDLLQRTVELLDILLTVHLSIILATDELNAHILIL